MGNRIKLKVNTGKNSRVVQKKNKATQFRKEHLPRYIKSTMSRRWHRAESESAASKGKSRASALSSTRLSRSSARSSKRSARSGRSKRSIASLSQMSGISEGGESVSKHSWEQEEWNPQQFEEEYDEENSEEQNGNDYDDLMNQYGQEEYSGSVAVTE